MNFLFRGPRYFSLLIASLFLFSFYYLPTDNNKNIETEATTMEEDISCCGEVFPPANFFCPGSYVINGTMPAGCSNFQLLPNNRCTGITVNVTTQGNSINLSGTVGVGAFCKFRYTLKDSEGNTCYYLVGIKALAADSPECCTTPPCM